MFNSQLYFLLLAQDGIVSKIDKYKDDNKGTILTMHPSMACVKSMKQNSCANDIIETGSNYVICILVAESGLFQINQKQ